MVLLGYFTIRAGYFELIGCVAKGVPARGLVLLRIYHHTCCIDLIAYNSEYTLGTHL